MRRAESVEVASNADGSSANATAGPTVIHEPASGIRRWTAKPTIAPTRAAVSVYDSRPSTPRSIIGVHTAAIASGSPAMTHVPRSGSDAYANATAAATANARASTVPADDA